LSPIAKIGKPPSKWGRHLPWACPLNRGLHHKCAGALLASPQERAPRGKLGLFGATFQARHLHSHHRFTPTLNTYPMIGKSTFRSLTLEHLDPAQWYGILFAIGCAMWPLFRLASRLLRSAWAWASNFFLKHFCYPHLYRRAIWASPVTRAQFLLILMYVAINTVAMTLGTDAAAQVSSRSGVLATFNLIALLAGSRFSSVAGCFGISLRVYTILHKWIGRMAILQAFTHTALSISRWRSNILGLVVGIWSSL
jgi:hypothetical protein